MRTYGATDVGMVRTSNQDVFKNTVLDTNAVLSVVCDGMGGAKAGNIASSLVADAVTDYVVKSYSPQMAALSIENLLKTAVASANLEVFKKASNDENLKGMGTTVVAALVRNDAAYIAHVGDSRAYIIENDEMRQITRDHSVIQDLIEGGHITPDEAKNHPEKNIITRAVGTRENVIVDFVEENIGDGILLLCTDGVTNTLTNNDIRLVLKKSNLEDAAEKLLQTANEKISNDNVTVTLVSQ